jgi:hypothetical protein
MPEMKVRVAARWVGKSAKIPEVVYVAIFLPPMESARLVKKFGKTHPTFLAKHMTIWFHEDGSKLDLVNMPFGKTIPLKIVGHGENDRVQVVVVKPPAGFKPKAGRVPHITMSLAPGASAKESNALLANPENIVWEQGLLTVEGKLGWWDGERERFDSPNG